MTRIKQRLVAIERSLAHVGEPSGLVLYDSTVPGAADRAVEEFRMRYPHYEGGIVVLPEKDNDDDDD